MHLSKLIIVCLGLIAVSYADDDEDIGMTSDELVGALEPFAEQCEIELDKEHIKQLIKSDENPHQNSKCFRECLFREFGMMNEGETKLNKDKAVEMLCLMFSEGKDDMEKIVEKCNGINEGVTEKCENAHQHAMCIIRELKEHGYKVPSPGK